MELSPSSSDDLNLPLWAGFVACGISVVCFGSSFVPAKKFQAGDGFFYQWVMCAAIWAVGLCVNAYRGFPKFEPLAMLGGALWCIGNCCAIPIIQCIGLALGMSLWGVANLTVGWASGAFGILGVEKQPVNVPLLNFIGAGVAIASVAVFATVQNSPEGGSKNASSPAVGDSDLSPLLDGNRGTSGRRVQSDVRVPFVGGGGSVGDSTVYDSVEADVEAGTRSIIWRCTGALGPVPKRVMGVVLSLASGFCYGVNFNPPQYRIDHGPPGTSRDTLDYVWPHFTGIFAMSTLILAVYTMVSKNKPAVYRSVILPGLASGLLWAVAQTGWFIANKTLSFPISFPIIASGPALVASLWGVLVFGEIRGKLQIAKLILAFLVTIAGVTLITLSKVLDHL